MPRRALAVSLLIVTSILAGCIAEPTDEGLAGQDVVDDLTNLLTATGDLPCDADVGAGTSTNLRTLVDMPLDELGAPNHGEVDVHGDLALVARYGTGGFSVVDLANPLEPAEVGVWDPDTGGDNKDVKWSSDGTAAIVGHPTGIYLVDVRDPAAPVVMHHEEQESQTHMVTIVPHGDGDLVVASRGDAEDLPIYHLVGEPGAYALELVSSVPLSPQARTLGVFGPHDLTRAHDAFYYWDPVLNAPTLWVANVWYGAIALDVTDPAAPEVILEIPNLGPPTYTHTVQTRILDDGMRLTVTVSEVGHNLLRAYDTTDLANPVLLDTWSVENPANPQHNIQLVPPYLYMAHYGSGTFVFEVADLVDGGGIAPVARLAAQEGGPSPSSPTTSALAATGMFDGTWDVVLKDGLLLTSSTGGGFHVTAFGCIDAGDPAMTSTG